MIGYSQIEEALRAAEKEPWKEQHDKVMRNHDIADKASEHARQALSLYGQIKSMMSAAITFENSRGTYELYLAWWRVYLPLVRTIDSLERQNFSVSLSKDFRRAFREASQFIETVKDRASAVKGFVDGKMVSKDQFLDELRSRPSA